MAHNLNFKNDKASFFGTQPAWHGLGTIVEGAQTSEQAIKLSQLDFDVVKRPIYACDDDCQDVNPYQKVEGYFATVRTDNNKPLGIVGSRYNVLQNSKAFEFIDNIVGSKQAIFESAGALGNGERIFLTCKLPQKLVVGLNDVADNYFFLTNSHDGSASIEMMFTQVYVVCQNTVREAMRTGKRKQRVKHTTNMQNKMFDAASAMGIAIQKLEDMQEAFNAMTKVNITDAQLRKFIEIAMNPKQEQISSEEFSTRFTNTVDEVMEYAQTADAQLIVERKGTLWGAYNAITGFYNNVESYKNEDTRVKTIMYGNGFQRSEKALNLAFDALTNTSILS